MFEGFPYWVTESLSPAPTLEESKAYNKVLIIQGGQATSPQDTHAYTL